MTARAVLAAPIPADARCILYIRVSTEKQARPDKVSPEVQRAACAALAMERGFTTYHVLEDHESGSSHKRFDPLVAFCQAHPQSPKAHGLVVCYDTSRLGRFGGESTRMYMGLLRRVGWDIQFAKERLPGGDTDGFVIEAYALAAKKYRDDLKQRAHDFMLKYARDEQRWMGRVPFGYRRNPATKKLVLGEARDIKTVRRIFARFAEGATQRTIARELTADKVHGPFNVYLPRPGKDGTRSQKWRACTVRAILANPAYAGTYRWHRRANGPTSDDPRVVRKDPAELVIVEHAHPALIAPAVWKAVQARLHRPARRQRIRSGQPYLLTGLGTHARCGAALVGGGGHDANKFYKCSAADDDKHDHSKCAGRRFTVNQQLLEQTVIERVAARVAGWLKSGALAKALDRLLAPGNGREGRAALERERRDLEAQRKQLIAKVTKGLFTDEEAADTVAEIRAGLARVDREVQELRLEPTRADLAKERERLLLQAADFPARIRRAAPALARELLTYWMVGFTVHDARRKGGDLRLEFTWRQVPVAVTDRLPPPARGRRCSRAACQRRSPR